MLSSARVHDHGRAGLARFSATFPMEKHNIASIGVLEKCGFTVIGEKDQEYILRLTAH
jgi:RimJ/RimL family protein N-acetyltransferase